MILLCAAASPGQDFGAAARHVTQHGEALEAAARARAEGDLARVQGNEQAAAAHLRDARRIFEAGRVLASGDVEAITIYAEALGLLGDADLGAEALEAAISLRPEDALLRARRAALLAEVGGHARAEAFAAALEALEKTETGEAALLAHQVLGRLFFRESMPALAREHWEAALALESEDAEAIIGLAALDARAGRVAAADAALEGLGRRALAHDTAIRRKLRPALWDFDRFRLLIEDEAEEHAAYARLLYRAARAPEAAVALQRATQLDGDRIELWLLQGGILSQLGNLRGARHAYREALRLDPEQEGLRRTLEQLDAAIAAEAGAASGGPEVAAP